MSNNNTTTRKMREPLTLEQVDAAFRNPANLFLSIHASDPGEQEEMSKYHFLTKDGEVSKNIIQSSFEAIVPPDLIVITFTPPGCLAVTDETLEEKLRKRFSDPNWIKKGKGKGTIDYNVEAIVNSAKIYYPGQKLLNQVMSFDTAPYYDIFTIDAGGGEVVNPVQWQDGKEISYLKKSTMEGKYKGESGDTSHNLRPMAAVKGKPSKKGQKTRVWGKTKQKIFGNLTVQKMLDKISRPKYTRAAAEKGFPKQRILYILACSPTQEAKAYEVELRERMEKKKERTILVAMVTNLREPPPRRRKVQRCWWLRKLKNWRAKYKRMAPIDLVA